MARWATVGRQCSIQLKLLRQGQAAAAVTDKWHPSIQFQGNSLVQLSCGSWRSGFQQVSPTLLQPASSSTCQAGNSSAILLKIPTIQLHTFMTLCFSMM